MKRSASPPRPSRAKVFFCVRALSFLSLSAAPFDGRPDSRRSFDGARDPERAREADRARDADLARPRLALRSPSSMSSSLPAPPAAPAAAPSPSTESPSSAQRVRLRARPRGTDAAEASTPRVSRWSRIRSLVSSRFARCLRGITERFFPSPAWCFFRTKLRFRRISAASSTSSGSSSLSSPSCSASSLASASTACDSSISRRCNFSRISGSTKSATFLPSMISGIASYFHSSSARR
mmetsp:Transcript_102457/g.249060  ORF Transcript_102457/g.249060 Transcript_102457/m.249060 type:complete len:237 (+) Transcript_102457:72-782(+)